MTYKDFTQMSVWQKAFNLLIKVYELTKSFPKEERYGIISDIRRSANSIVHNIAEACLAAGRDLEDMKKRTKQDSTKFQGEVVMK